MEPSTADIQDWSYHRRVDEELSNCPVCGGPLPCQSCLNNLRNDP